MSALGGRASTIPYALTPTAGILGRTLVKEADGTQDTQDVPVFRATLGQKTPKMYLTLRYILGQKTPKVAPKRGTSWVGG